MGKPANVFLITGTDQAIIATTAEKLVREVAGENPDPFSLDVIREREGASTAEVVCELLNSLASPSFLGGRKTVWLQTVSAFEAEGAKTSKTAEAKAFAKLCEVIQAGLPEDMLLVMSGSGVDQRKRLYKVCKELGNVTVCNKPEVRNRNWQAEMGRLVQEAARAKGMRLRPDVTAYLVEVLGTDTLRIDPELEKLCCYCGGPEAQVTLADAQEICLGSGEAMSWSFSDALGHRQLDEAMRLLDVLLRQEKEPEGAVLGLLLQTAGRFRQLLQLRVFMQEKNLRSPGQVMSAVEGLSKEAKETAVASGFECISFHPYRVKMLAEQAVKFSGPELVRSIGLHRDANRACVGSNVSNRVIMEQLIIKLLGTGSGGH